MDGVIRAVKRVLALLGERCYIECGWAYEPSAAPPPTTGGHLNSKLRVIVADGNAAFLEQLKSILRRHFDVVASARDGSSALELIRQHKTDIAVLELALAKLNGFQVTEQAARLLPRPCIVICSTETDTDIVAAAKNVGASAYVFKHRVQRDLVVAIESALQGTFFAANNDSKPGHAEESLN